MSNVLSRAACDILAERQRQIENEGWTLEHDDKHAQGELARAAACYALFRWPGPRYADYVACIWPWAHSWWKPVGHRRNLVKAGALILAEIERLDRVAAHLTDGHEATP